MFDSVLLRLVLCQPAVVKKDLKAFVKTVAQLVDRNWHDGYEEQGEELANHKALISEHFERINTLIMHEPASEKALTRAHEILEIIADSWADMQAVRFCFRVGAFSVVFSARRHSCFYSSGVAVLVVVLFRLPLFVVVVVVELFGDLYCCPMQMYCMDEVIFFLLLLPDLLCRQADRSQCVVVSPKAKATNPSS